jgi:Pgp3 C-terminal domain
MSIVLVGSTSGSCTLQEQAVAGNTVLTLPTTSGTLITTASSGQSIPKAALPTGSVLQVVNSQTGTTASGSGTIPQDNTIPQNNEGTEFITASITPTSSSSKLLILVNLFASNNASGFGLTAALFQDSTANALAATNVYQGTANGRVNLSLVYYMTAGTTSSTTFKVRAGGDSGTTYLNGVSTQYFGGVGISSLTIMEIAA